jgi:glycosyl transferase family 2
MEDEWQFEPASLVDPVGRLVRYKNRIFRAIRPQYVDEYRNTLAEAEKGRWFDHGLVRTWISDQTLPDFPLILEHERLPFVTYRGEWPALAQKRAAQGLLSLTIVLLRSGYCIKDAHPWNTLFDGVKPKFVDFTSIRLVAEMDGPVWFAEFRKYFLYPLLMFARGDVGLARSIASEHMRGAGLWMIDNEPARIGSVPEFSEYDEASLNALLSFVSDISFPVTGGEWGEYAQPGVGTEVRKKDHQVAEALDRLTFASAIDIGTNRGLHAHLCAQRGAKVVACDIEEACLNDLFAVVEQRGSNITPLYLDITTPPGAAGFFCTDRAASDRLRCDVVLALALVHHVCFRRRFPVDSFVSTIASFTNDAALIEFVPDDDLHVAQWKLPPFDDYSIEGFRSTLYRYFSEVEDMPIEPDPRRLFICRGRRPMEISMSKARALSNPRFTVLLPVIRRPVMLPTAIDSVLAQNLTDFELFVIGDGAPEETIACAQSYAARDPRVKVFSFPKGEGVGELHRHAALEQARGIYVAHISDDDFWFPNHLEEMEKLLQQVDFGNLIHVEARPDGSYEVLPSNVGRPTFRRRMLEQTFNALGDTVTGYRMTAYRALPVGWAPPPIRPNPDLLMWRKFLGRDDLTFGTRMVVTALIFPTERRRHMSLEERAQEIRRYYEYSRDPRARAEITQAAWHAAIDDLWHRQDDRDARMDVIRSLQAQLERMQALASHRLEDGCQIDFSANGNSPLYTMSGWSEQEADRRWTNGKEAVIRVRLERWARGRPPNPQFIQLRAIAFGTQQRVSVVVNGGSPVERTMDNDWRDYDIPIGPGNPAEYEVKFVLPDAHSPKSSGLSQDTRELGIGLSSLAFLPPAPERIRYRLASALRAGSRLKP